MNTKSRMVTTAAELLVAAADPDVSEIIAGADIENVPTFRLSPGQTLVGSASGLAPLPRIRFAAGADGLQLSTDNYIQGLNLVTAAEQRAVFNDTAVVGLGRLVLQTLSVTGRVQLLARDAVRSGHIEAHDIDIVAADARGEGERPKGYGVEVIPGAFTLWNQQADPAVTITADLTGLSAGRAGAPVRGSGIFAAGAGDVGGRLVVRCLETGPVYSDGGIAPSTPDRISGGVFVVSGAVVDTVCNCDPVTTYGPNDMVLDNWGTVDKWVVKAKVTSYGPSGIGFVNFGTIELLKVQDIIETFGQGARGFNVYDGTVRRAEFDRLITHADGAVGIQISQPVGQIIVHRGIETYGGVGDSLVKGKVVRLAAIPLSIKPGGAARAITIQGGLRAHGTSVVPLELYGTVASLHITGGLAADTGASGSMS